MKGKIQHYSVLRKFYGSTCIIANLCHRRRSFSISQFVCLSVLFVITSRSVIYPPLIIYLTINTSICLPICLAAERSSFSYQAVCLSIYLSIYIPTYLPIYLSVYLSTFSSIYLSFKVCTFCLYSIHFR